MKRLISLIAILRYSTAITLTIFIGALALLPASASADACTDQGGLPTSDGTCCPSGQGVFTTSGSQTIVTCNHSSDKCNGDVSNTDALYCVFQRYINPTIQLLSATVGILVVITIIRGALAYTMSAGDPAKVAAGKQHILNALIGLGAYLALYVFLQFILPGGLF